MNEVPTELHSNQRTTSILDDLGSKVTPMQTNFKNSLALAALSLSLNPTLALAEFVDYSNAALWQGATSDRTTISGDMIPIQNNITTEWQSLGVTVTAGPLHGWELSGGGAEWYADNWGVPLGTHILTQLSYLNYFELSFSEPTRAFSVMTAMGNDARIDAYMGDTLIGSTAVYHSYYNVLTFRGITSSAPFDSIRVTPIPLVTQEYPYYHWSTEFSFSAVPTPGALSVLAIAALTKRRRR